MPEPRVSGQSRYEAYVQSLTPCPECGWVDEMDNIERGPFPLCAACYLDQNDDDKWDEFGDDYELDT